MGRRRLIIANWKMHLISKDVSHFFETFAGLQSATTTRGRGSVYPDVLVAAPATLLKITAESSQNRNGLRVIAQNVHASAQGAFTGEISTDMIRDAAASGSIVGHSERRQYFAETDETVAAKTRRLLECGMVAITCVGESLAEREAGTTDAVIRRQMRPIMDALQPLITGSAASPDLLQRWAIAYEPVWAIGTGKAATAGQAQDVHCRIRDEVAEHLSKDCANAIRVLYGGSVKAGNIREFLDQSDIDGALVGGASIDPQGFSDIVDAAIII